MTDNKRGKRTLEYDEADALMMANAMMIASNTAMMSQRPLAMERLNAYRDAFIEAVPQEARLFEGSTWAEIGIALSTASSFRVELVPQTSHEHWWSKGQVEVTVMPAQAGGKTSSWRSRDYDIPKGDERIAAVHAILGQLAPMGCEGGFDDGQERPESHPTP